MMFSACGLRSACPNNSMPAEACTPIQDMPKSEFFEFREQLLPFAVWIDVHTALPHDRERREDQTMIVDELVAEAGRDADTPLAVDRVSEVSAKVHIGPANHSSVCAT